MEINEHRFEIIKNALKHKRVFYRGEAVGTGFISGLGTIIAFDSDYVFIRDITRGKGDEVFKVDDIKIDGSL